MGTLAAGACDSLPVMLIHSLAVFNVEDDLDALVRECAAEPDQRMLRLNGIAAFLWGGMETALVKECPPTRCSVSR